ncbi:bifunctional hydroxymethylpyrimidine kinase/phosphomethylpyrimidine kinase [Fodinibius halophilus]|uniref:hydroxymethylpyrimidine kinase n=1 Tax=Fodinibius halophilus TaxID=1736908 RepID=A0A6M1T9C6_9BACT|nr:bifunctional hydroxymethylpyrimidine kinase/phosphomethylpyrimidine kinase [Fodinibius halophilus]NGP88601.1 bifunctional hydroxymethylpyrimidine kinase/phosphomethylpyrimidine kinase [Fodinibius halophilus]
MQENSKQSYDSVLTIATSDSGGGAGVQADLKTISALGCYGMSAFAALTAQNTQEVRDIHEVPPQFLRDQIDVVVEDFEVDAVKIGMLFTGELMQVVADCIEKHNLKNVVLDPVMVSQSGAQLIKDGAIAVIRETLFPLADLITPNIPEAERLLGRELEGEEQMKEAVYDLLDTGTGGVLLKGGHFKEEQSIDYLSIADENPELHQFKAKRIETDNTHGTGCTLSSAIAAYLAKGYPMPKAVEQAKLYITQAIAAGSQYRIGGGGGPLHHFHQFWN